MTFPSSRFIIVTGTDTGVGKTVTTAALAVLLESRGMSVAVVKPVQTGMAAGEPSDVEEINRLTGLASVIEFVRLSEPLAPVAAARLDEVDLPSMEEHVRPIRDLDADVVLIEGAGGLLVPLDGLCRTVVDLGAELDADFVVVGHEGLGSLNHFALTVEHLRHQGVEPHLVIGSCAADPGLAAVSNRIDLPQVTGLVVEGRIPEGAGGLSREEFRSQAPAWFTFH
ncbi:MAG: dethiobiotin synthase [Actinomycetota bacterium]|nr:dethiobiotin synthase [Actinomycetota bacterium]